MSLLANALGGDLGSGVYHWHSDLDQGELEEQTDAAGWRLVILDTNEVTDKEGVLEACREAFDFPDWTGRNYDALVDALRDVRGPNGALVVWEGWETLARADRSVFDTVFSIMRRRGEFGPGGLFVVFLRR